MSDAPALSGPDLSLGIPITDLPDGGMLLGHAEGEPVLLTRIGDELFAVGAVCSHWNGPLAEGLVVGDTVRCPWHHACFSLRTGEALRAPALNPISCWNVDRRKDQVMVTGRKEAPAPPASSKHPDSVLIIGGGGAGNAAAEMLRRQGYAGTVTMLSADENVPCDRPNLSKDFLAGNAQEDWIPLRSPEWYAEHKITLRLATRVKALDAAKRTVTLENGETISAGAILLAMGAEPVHLPLPGAEQPHVHYLRTFADSRSIIEALRTAKRAVVLGASFIGLEVAASLRTRGLEVHVVAPEARPLERIMGPEIGDLIRNVHEQHGVTFHLGLTAKSIERLTVTLTNGETIPADLVVIGVGVRPSLALSEAAGLTMDRGVLVNEFLETSAPGVYAAGDIARWPDPHTGDRLRIEHWVTAERLGQTAARNIMGRKERFEAVPFFWSSHYDVTISYIGHAEKWDRIEVHGSLEKMDAAVSFHQGDRILAVATINRDRALLLAETAAERDDTAGLEAAVRVGDG